MRTALFSIVLITAGLNAQSSSDSLAIKPPMGFVDIRSDSLGAPLYIDGIYLGKSPLGRPIPVLAGKHEVSLFPISGLDPYVKKRLSGSIKNIHIAEGDTVDVLLFYDVQDQRIESIRKEHKAAASIGYFLLSIFLGLMWIGAG